MSIVVSSDLKDIVKDYMLRNGLDRKKFCEISQISNLTLVKVLSGERNFQYNTIRKITKVVGHCEEVYNYRRFPTKNRFGVVKFELIETYMKRKGVYFSTFCHKCGVKMWDMRNILFNYHRASSNEDFYKIAKTLDIEVEKLFEGISAEAKEKLIAFQKPLPCNLD